jgi:hypothetical protein
MSHTATEIDRIDKWAFVRTVILFGFTAIYFGGQFPAIAYLVLTLLVIRRGDLLAEQSNQGRWTAATAIPFFVIGWTFAVS